MLLIILCHLLLKYSQIKTVPRKRILCDSLELKTYLISILTFLALNICTYLFKAQILVSNFFPDQKISPCNRNIVLKTNKKIFVLFQSTCTCSLHKKHLQRDITHRCQYLYTHR